MRQVETSGPRHPSTIRKGYPYPPASKPDPGLRRAYTLVPHYSKRVGTETYTALVFPLRIVPASHPPHLLRARSHGPHRDRTSPPCIPRATSTPLTTRQACLCRTQARGGWSPTATWRTNRGSSTRWRPSLTPVATSRSTGIFLVQRYDRLSNHVQWRPGQHVINLREQEKGRPLFIINVQ